MYFQILEIILWPKKTSFGPRWLTFKPGCVNVISGSSKTGKSAIIPIVDYCLGSDKCTIPVNTIRNACEWFGVLIQTINGQKLFARREPGDQKSTGDMYVQEGNSIIIPGKIEQKNASVDYVKRSLDELAGLTTLDFDNTDTRSGFRDRPSFRDLTAFTFQPQNIIANPDVFFYKADTYEHREKLRTIFPFILNAITPQLLAKRHELSQLRKELRRKENELDTVKQVSERWMAEIRSRVAEAKELGLINEFVSESIGREGLVKILEVAVKSSIDDSRITSETISTAIDELMKLQHEETEASTQLSILRKRLAEMSELKESTIQYHGALQIQRDRLQVSEWLRNIHDEQHSCPICGNNFKSTSLQLDGLFKSLKEIELTADELETTPASFDREFEKIREEIRTSTETLQGIRYRRERLQRSSDEVKDHHYETLRVSRFIGNLEQSLMTYARIGTDSVLDNEVQSLKERVHELEKEISENEVKKRVERSLARVHANAQRLLPALEAERSDDPIELSINDLSIKVKGKDRDDYLWEIGSGSNWLAYHLAVTLGLQQFFISLEQSPVPSFIIYDQPSQVYFPRIVSYKDTNEDWDPLFSDEDLSAVRKVFQSLSTSVIKNQNELQIIVLDHAPESVWENLDLVYKVEEWRDGRKLVPLEWLSE